MMGLLEAIDRLEERTMQHHARRPLSPPKASLDAHLACQHLKIVPVPKDGNCQFHAVADQLRRVSPRAADAWMSDSARLRREAVDRIASTYDAKTFFALGDETVPKATYIKRMRKRGECGDEYTLRAMSDITGHDIRVVREDGTQNLIECPQKGVEPPLKLTLGFFPEWHYVSTAPL